MCLLSQRLCTEAGESLDPLAKAYLSLRHPPLSLVALALMLLDLPFSRLFSLPLIPGFLCIFTELTFEIIGKDDDSVASWLAQKGCDGDAWSHIPFMRNAFSAADEAEGEIMEPLLREDGRGGSTRGAYKDPFGSKEISESNGTVFSRRRYVKLSHCIVHDTRLSSPESEVEKTALGVC